MSPRARWHVSLHPASVPAQTYTGADAPSALVAAERWARSFDPFNHPQDDTPKDVVHADVLDLSTGRRITARITRSVAYACEAVDADTAASADDAEDAARRRDAIEQTLSTCEAAPFDDAQARALAHALIPEPRTGKQVDLAIFTVAHRHTLDLIVAVAAAVSRREGRKSPHAATLTAALMTVTRHLRSLDDRPALREERQKTKGKKVLKNLMAQLDDMSPHWRTLRRTECLDETARAAILWYLDRIPALAPTAADTTTQTPGT